MKFVLDDNTIGIFMRFKHDMTGTLKPNQGIVQLQTMLYLYWIYLRSRKIVSYSIKDLGMDGGARYCKP
jgi:hypothetical protein